MIVPQEFPTQPDPLTLQVTAVLTVPVTVALNCCCPFTTSGAKAGETVTPTFGCAWIVTEAFPGFAVTKTAMAVTVTLLGLGTLAGAVYKPEAVIVPQVMPLHPAPVTFQITNVGVPAIAAENWTCEPGLTWTELGETVTATAALD